MANVILGFRPFGTWEPDEKKISPPKDWIVEVSHLLSIIILDPERRMMIVPSEWTVVGLEPPEPPLPPPFEIGEED